MPKPTPNRHRKIFKSPVARIIFASLMLIIGCVLPIIFIQAQNQIPRWKIGALELIGLGGLALLLAQLVLKIKIPLRIYNSGAILTLLVIGLAG